MWDKVLIALEIMGKGMVGIFTVIFIIMLCIMAMNALLKEKEKKSENEN